MYFLQFAQTLLLTSIYVYCFNLSSSGDLGVVYSEFLALPLTTIYYVAKIDHFSIAVRSEQLQDFIKGSLL